MKESDVVDTVGFFKLSFRSTLPSRLPMASGSIVTARTTACPNCHAYQFDLTPARVVEQARALALRSASSVLSSDLA